MIELNLNNYEHRKVISEILRYEEAKYTDLLYLPEISKGKNDEEINRRKQESSRKYIEKLKTLDNYSFVYEGSIDNITKERIILNYKVTAFNWNNTEDVDDYNSDDHGIQFHFDHTKIDISEIVNYFKTHSNNSFKMKGYFKLSPSNDIICIIEKIEKKYFKSEHTSRESSKEGNEFTYAIIVWISIICLIIYGVIYGVKFLLNG
jgi:hypothetical protein